MVLDHYCKEFPYENVLEWVRISNARVKDGAIRPVSKGTTKVFMFNEDELLVFASIGDAANYLELGRTTFQNRIIRNHYSDGYWIMKEGECET